MRQRSASSFLPLIKINWQQILSHERRMDACCPYARYILICLGCCYCVSQSLLMESKSSWAIRIHSLLPESVYAYVKMPVRCWKRTLGRPCASCAFLCSTGNFNWVWASALPRSPVLIICGLNVSNFGLYCSLSFLGSTPWHTWMYWADVRNVLLSSSDSIKTVFSGLSHVGPK